MTKFFRSFYYILPFVVGGFVFYKVDLNSSEEQLQKKEKSIEKIESSKNSDDDIKLFLDANDFIFKSSGYDKVLVKKDGKVLGISDIDENKKLLIKIIAYNKARKNLNNFLSEKKLNLDEKQELKEFSKNIQNEIDKTKNILYKIYEVKLHPLDKDFLEALK